MPTYLVRPNVSVSNAWTSNGTFPANLAEVVTQPTAPATGSGYISSSTANAVAITEFDTASLPLDEFTTNFRLWVYARGGVKRAVRAELLNASNVQQALAENLVPADAALGWYYLDMPGAWPQPQLDNIRARFTVLSTAGGGGASAPIIYAAYIEVTTTPALTPPIIKEFGPTDELFLPTADQPANRPVVSRVSRPSLGGSDADALQFDTPVITSVASNLHTGILSPMIAVDGGSTVDISCSVEWAITSPGGTILRIFLIEYLSTNGILSAPILFETTPSGNSSGSQRISQRITLRSDTVRVAFAMRFVTGTTAGNKSGQGWLDDFDFIYADLPPAAPTGLTATPDVQQVTLDWDNSAESDFASFAVERSTDQTNWSSIGDPTASTLLDTGLTAGQTYYYRVATRDVGGNLSTWVTTSAVPTAPPQTDFDAPVVTLVNVSGTELMSQHPDHDDLVLRIESSEEFVEWEIRVASQPTSVRTSAALVQGGVVAPRTQQETTIGDEDIAAAEGVLTQGDKYFMAWVRDAAGNWSAQSAFEDIQSRTFIDDSTQMHEQGVVNPPEVMNPETRLTAETIHYDYGTT